MTNGQALAVAAATLGAAFLLVQWANSQADAVEVTDPETGDTYTTEQPSIFEDFMSQARTTLGIWRAPAQYAGLIASAEVANGIPATMLERLLWQECRWREDIISGRVRSPVGAVGIAQFMPATAREMGIDPLNVPQAIDGAGRYLARLYRMFGNWSEALAAYNWGMGNVQRKGLGAAPAETRSYYTSILADVNAATGNNWA
ncbi:lytic transglycosylase domain-containing protein [Acidovorax delafieldii]|uniref:lytic transglycosylase domain-containing protein n=1 Tax=Acidovorax delafieldii TaxID=47920 RepID=UPI003ECFDF38